MTPARIVDLFSAETAGRVLAGDWVRLFPLFQGEGYWRGGFFHPLTVDLLDEMERIFRQRAELGLPARLAVNAEHDSTGGAFGWIVDFEARADGGYVRIEPTKRGRELLEDDSFAYLSAEVYWEYELPTTGQTIGPVLSGAAFTNDPFFGEATAMYSLRAVQHSIGGQPATSGSPDNTGPTPHTTGGNRMSEELVLTPEEQTSLQRFMHDPLGFLFGRQGQGTEPGHADAGAEEFSRQMEELRAQMQRQAQQLEQFAVVAAERNELRGRVDSLEGQLSDEQSRRLADRFSRQAQGYRALGADAGEMAAQLQWLYTADGTEGHEHFAWFEALLATVDEGLAAGEAFSERGQSGGGASGPAEQFSQMVAQKVEAGKSFEEAVRDVSREYPQLYTQAYLPQRQ